MFTEHVSVDYYVIFNSIEFHFIYIALLTMYVFTKQLYISDKVQLRRNYQLYYYYIIISK